MVYFVCCLTSLFIDIPLFYYINLRSSIILWLCSEDICLSLYISLSIPVFSSSFATGLFCGEVLETFLILSAILLSIKSPVASAVFWIALFEAVLNASIADGLAWSGSFWLYLLLKFFYFCQYFFPYSWQKTKTHSLLHIFNLLVELNNASFFICYTLINN